MHPGVSLQLPAKGGEIHQRQLELDHALRPWSSRRRSRSFQTSADPYQTVQRKRCSRRRKHKEKARDPQERITAVQHPQISLLYGNQAEKHGYAAEARPETDRKKQSEAQKNPEECRDPAIVLWHQREQVEPHTRLYLRRRCR